MMIPSRTYEFTPPSGGPPIAVHGLQDYSPGQTRKVEIWRLEVPAEHVAKLGSHIEFDSWATMLATLANMFCDGDKDAAEARLILKFSDQPPLAE